MTHHDRRQPSRNNTNSSWITIDWGKPQAPSKLHGVLDQIAGQILRDRKLIDQGKAEWRRAIHYRRKKSSGARKSGSSTPSKTKTISRDPSRRGGRIAAGARKTSGTGGLTGIIKTLFGDTKAKVVPTRTVTSPTPERKTTIRRAMTKPGEHRDRTRSSRPSGGAARRPSERQTARR